MKRVLQSLLVGAAVVWLSACGSGSYSSGGVYPNPNGKAKGMIAGNWVITTTSNDGTGSNGSFQPIVISWEGPVAVASNAITMNAYTYNDNWSGNPNYGDTVLYKNLPVAGSQSGNNLTFAITAANGLTINITALASNGTYLTGTYQATATKAGKDQATSFSGTVTGNYVPPLNGYWEGKLKETKEDLFGVLLRSNTSYALLTLSQGSTPVQCTGCGPESVYPLSGTVSFDSAVCYEAGTIDPAQSYVVGGTVKIVFKAADGISYTMPQGSLPVLDPAQPTTLNFNAGGVNASTTNQIFTPLCPNDGTYTNVEQATVNSVVTPVGP